MKQSSDVGVWIERHNLLVERDNEIEREREIEKERYDVASEAGRRRDGPLRKEADHGERGWQRRRDF